MCSFADSFVGLERCSKFAPLVGENFMTRVRGRCSLLVVDGWYTCISQTKPARGLNHVLAET